MEISVNELDSLQSSEGGWNLLVISSSEKFGRMIHLAVSDTHAGRDPERGEGPGRKVHLICPVAAFVGDS